MQNTGREGKEGGGRWAEEELRPPCTVGKSEFFSSPRPSFSLPSRKPHRRCRWYHFLLHLFSVCAFSHCYLGSWQATCWSKTGRSQHAVGSGPVGRAGNKLLSSPIKFTSLNHMPFYQATLCYLNLFLDPSWILNMLFPCLEYLAEYISSSLQSPPGVSFPPPNLPRLTQLYADSPLPDFGWLWD